MCACVCVCVVRACVCVVCARACVRACATSDIRLVRSPFFFFPDPACATYATATYPKTLRCPCSSEDEVSVTWCLTCPIGGSGICFNSTSVTSVIGDCLRSYTNGQLSLTQYSTTISFRNDTSIYILTIDLTYRLTTFNCTCQCNGSRCGEKGNFTLAIDSKLDGVVALA